MAKLTKAESKYSWWWDSHISPKNSKWLHENLTDMDTKVKQMIKLIEVDEDSFARRAEMYYKKRPELMKLFEEFYRAFRALAERYDHATGVIKQAHNTMPQAFSNQNPFIELDDESFTSPDEGSSHSQPDNAEFVSVEEKGFPHVKKEVSIRDVCEKELQIQMEEELDQDLSSQFEICILHSVLFDMKETNSSLLEKLFKTSKLSEELILELEYENIEQHEVVKFLSEQLSGLRMGMFQLSKVLDVDHELKCEDNIERDQIILHHILNKLHDTRCSFCKAWDENQKLLIEKSVLETSLGQLKQELSDLKSVITGLQQEYRVGNDRLLSSQEDLRKLIQSHEQLILRIDEGNHREKSLVAEMVNLRKQLLEMQDACQLKAAVRLNDENDKLEHDNSCLIVDGDTLLLIFKTIGLERTEMINQLARNSGKLCDDMKEIQTENSQLRLELARKNGDLYKKEMDCSEVVTLKVDEKKQIIELTERYDKQLKENESLHKSTQSELKKARVEAEMWETIVGTSFVELQTSSVREALFEEKLCELSREYECLEDENHSKKLEILKLKERIESLEGENNQINTQLGGHVQALATMKEAITSLESHTGLVNEKDSACCSQEPSKNDISSFYDIAIRIKAVETKVVQAKKLSQSPRSKGSRLRHGSVGLSRSSESSESKSSRRHNHHRQQIMMKDMKLDQASKVSSRRKNTESDDRILELWETMDEAGSIDLTVGRTQKEYCDLREVNNKRKIVDRIASDVMKLTNLQITVQDLQQKVGNPTKGEGLEYVKVKEQLDEAEKAIAKLKGVNCRLMRNAGSSDKVMERARRWQEKIGRLEMDVKRVEFMVVKLDGESGSVAERKTEIVLKDYLYGNSRSPQRRRKGSLCGCILPRTSRD